MVPVQLRRVFSARDEHHAMDEYGESMLELSRKLIHGPAQSSGSSVALTQQPLLTQQHADSASVELTEAALMRVQALMDEIPRRSKHASR